MSLTLDSFSNADALFEDSENDNMDIDREVEEPSYALDPWHSRKF